MSVAIAKRTPSLKVIVEDLAQLKEQAEKYIADEGQSDNVTFVSHDFFSPQPESARGACAYFLSLVIHDWPDEKCRVIIKHIVDAMMPSSAILIYESLLPEPGQLLEYEGSIMYTQDITMFTLVAARERSLSDMQKLMSSVDDRLVVTSVFGPLAMRRTHLIEFKIGE
jgi:6-hydroxytryprostatin B O-methyltransferase